MTKELGSQSPAAESPIDDQYKSKRGRKPSQAKLAMLESKRLFADKKRFLDTDSGEKRQIKKKKMSEDVKSKNTAKIKKKKNSKVS